MSDRLYNGVMEGHLAAVERALTSYLPKDDSQNTLYQIMEYACAAGGKRLRPVLALEFAIYGGDVQKALPFACAVEMIHSYSLVLTIFPVWITARRGAASVGPCRLWRNHGAFGGTPLQPGV